MPSFLLTKTPTSGLSEKTWLKCYLHVFQRCGDSIDTFCSRDMSNFSQDRTVDDSPINTSTKDILSEQDIDECKIIEDAHTTWICPKCNKSLSRKQTLKAHLFVKHQIRAGNLVKRYKLYETDSSVPVPSSTSHKWKHTEQEQSDKNPITVNCYAITDIETNATSHTEREQQNILHQQNTCQETETEDLQCDNLSEIDMDIESDVISSSDSESDQVESTSDEDDFDVEKANTIASPPLYIIPPLDTLTNAPLTHLEHLLIVSGYATACNLSGVAFQKLLDVIRFHVPKNNICETKTDEVKQKLGFGNVQDLKYFECCSKCGLLFKATDICETPGCGTRRDMDENDFRRTCFVTCNLKKQLQEILERKGIDKKLQAELKKSAPTGISDITTGSEYLKLKTEGQFLDPKFNTNITLSWNTDGIPLFKSSGVSLWPVYLTINELPPKERLLKKNILIWGVWQGISKPGSMNGFLSPFVKDMTELFTEGVDVCGEVWKALLLTGTMDLQARAYVLNMTQHNGRFGCLYCIEEGLSVASGGGHCRSYPFRNESAQIRNSKDINQAVSTAAATGKINQGFMGKSVVSYLPMYFIEKHIVIDYMHGILLGIVKKLLSLWFDGKNFQEQFFIGQHLDKIDKLLKKIKPPYLLSRLPRKMKNNYHRWKASELRSWLLHYSLPCLSGLLPNIFLEHFACLVEGIYLLLQQTISIADIERAEVLLCSFYQHAADIYGSQFLGLNVHNLQHYTSCVKMWGPLWAYSCFGYESCNGDILKNVHGKGNVCAQIFWAMQAQKRLEKETSTLPKGDLRSFLQKLLSGGAKLLPKTLDAYKCDIVPPLCDLQNVSPGILAQLQSLSKDPTDIQQLAKVRKIVINETMFYSQASSNVKRRNSYTVILDKVLEDGSDIISVEYYIVTKEQYKVFAVGTTFSRTGPVVPGRMPHLQMVKRKRKDTVVPAHWLQELLVFMDFSEDRKYVSRFPNFIEKD